MKLLLTGAKRVGKSTLLKELVPKIKPDFWIIAHELRTESGERRGFEAETSTGRKCQFAYKFSNRPGITMGNYQVDLAAVDRLYTEPIRTAAQPGRLLIIDEIGRTQMLSPNFKQTVTSLFNGTADVIATIPLQDDWTKYFTERPEVVTLVLDATNREQIKEQILSAIARR